MPDQAAGLRSLFARRRPSLLIVAGADPCKAAVAVHFAREAATGRRATVLIDGTVGDAAGACDVACRYELSHVLAGDMPMSDVLRPLTPHLLLMPAARALSRYGSFTADEDARLAEAFANGIPQALAEAGSEDTQIDLIVVLAEEAKASQAVEAFGRDARVVVVASENALSLRGAYAEMKALAQLQGLENFEIVVPRFDDGEISSVPFQNLSTAARRFLEIELKDGGTVLLERPRAVVGSRPTLSASSPFARRDPSDDAASSESTPSTSTAEVHHAAVA